MRCVTLTLLYDTMSASFVILYRAANSKMQNLEENTPNLRVELKTVVKLIHLYLSFYAKTKFLSDKQALYFKNYE